METFYCFGCNQYKKLSLKAETEKGKSVKCITCFEIAKERACGKRKSKHRKLQTKYLEYMAVKFS